MRPLREIYFADENGFWEGQQNFQYPKAKYQFNFDNFTATRLYYEETINELYFELQRVGSIVKNLNGAGNILYWMTYLQRTLSDPTAAEIPTESWFYMTGSPVAVFKSNEIYSAIVSLAGYCEAPSYGRINSAQALLELTMDGTYYSNSKSTCPRGLDRSNKQEVIFGEKYGYLHDLRLFIDLHTMMTTIAVNEGVFPSSTISEWLEIADLDSFNFKDETRSLSVPIYQYYDRRYPGMEPLVCVNDTRFVSSNICVMIIGDQCTISILKT